VERRTTFAGAMRRVAAVVALLGGMSLVGACGGGSTRPVSMRLPTMRPASMHAGTAPKAAAAPAGAPGGPAAAMDTFADQRARRPDQAWVAVPVATLWDQPGLVRPVDQPVVQPQPDVRKWLASMDLGQKLNLDYTMATQALMDEPLTVIEVSGKWADVLVEDQTGSVYPDGVEGWIPVSQITYTPPPASADYATVSEPLADAGGLELSYGTRLPVLSSESNGYVVATPYGERVLPSADARTAAPRVSPQAVLQEAEKFLGLPYLWAGTSAYGFDCSGLTYAVYKQFGITLARDAGDQALQGRPVPRDVLQPGDLMFFAWAGQVDHVGIYAGHGTMLQAPETGSQVEIVDIWSSPLAQHYAGARRYFG
jgi:cell wall-associated NlpC family hydrolase